MKVRVTTKFIDKEATAKKGEPVVRKVGEEYSVSKERYEEIQKAGNFVEKVVEEKKPEEKAK